MLKFLSHHNHLAVSARSPTDHLNQSCAPLKCLWARLSCGALAMCVAERGRACLCLHLSLCAHVYLVTIILQLYGGFLPDVLSWCVARRTSAGEVFEFEVFLCYIDYTLSILYIELLLHRIRVSTLPRRLPVCFNWVLALSSLHLDRS